MSNAIVLFVDASEANYSYKYAFKKNEGVAQIASRLPSNSQHTKGELYVLKDIPQELVQALDNRLQKKGDIHPPFQPGGGAMLIQIIYSSDSSKAVATEYFDYVDNNETRKWCGQLRSAIINPSNRVPTMPEWIAENKRIARHFEEE
jgi:hypothetical protein